MAGVVLRFWGRSVSPQQRASKVLVLKKEHKLLLLDHGNNVIQTYSSAIGLGGLEPKQRQGDHKSPEGIYVIDRHRGAADSIVRYICRTQTTLIENAHER